jgi:8-oxo-dGTP diphosphatase
MPPTPRYCWNCAQPLKSVPPTVCEICGQGHYANPKPCGEAVVIRRGQVLLIQRARDPWRGAWDLPGGFCDGDEHPMHAAERELFEEVGIKAEAVAYLGTWIDVYGPPARDGLVDHTANSAYILDTSGAEQAVTPQLDEVTAACWFPMSDPPAQLAFPEHLTKVLKAASVVYPQLGNLPELYDRAS